MGYRKARLQALNAVAAAPREPEAIVDIAQRLRPFAAAAEVRQLYKRLLPLSRVGVPALLRFAKIASAMNLQEEAIACLDEARRGDPGFPPTLASRAQVLTYLGRLEEAGEELDRCISIAPEFAMAHWLRSRLHEWTLARNHVDELRREIKREPRKPEEQVLLYYALHKELDDIGEHALSWYAMQNACRLRRAALAYDEQATFRLFDALAAAPITATTAAAFSDVGTTPVFIVGMHRSGTTLLEQMLARHSCISDMGELYDFTAQMRFATDYHCRGVVDIELIRRSADLNFGDVGRAYLSATAWRSRGREFAIDKLPSNFLNLGFILRAFPQARVLHMVRDPIETCFSNLRELFSDANPWSYDQRELADYFACYWKLMEQWKAAFPSRIHDVSYDALLNDSESCLRGIAAYCGFEYEDEMLRPGQGTGVVATASAVQVRAGLRRRSVAKWRPYSANLAPLAARLRWNGVPNVPDLDV